MVHRSLRDCDDVKAMEDGEGKEVCAFIDKQISPHTYPLIRSLIESMNTSYSHFDLLTIIPRNRDNPRLVAFQLHICTLLVTESDSLHISAKPHYLKKFI
jgi:hypothetical protein